MTTDVTMDGIVHRFGTFTALDHVTLQIGAGSYAVLLGPSGCGKTTLLSILGGFLQPSAGRVLFGERDVTAVPPARRPSTTMFQDYALFPHLSIGDNVAFGLRMRRVDRRLRRLKAGEMLALVGLEGMDHKRPHQLSGGQRQRVALARALAVEPDLLLLDEPLGALDLKLRRQMQDELKAIQKRVGTTFVHVTHDQEEAMAIADAIIVMDRGRVQDQGTPERIYLRPASRFTAAFMGEANFLKGRLEAADGHGPRIATRFGSLDLADDAFTQGVPAIGTDVEVCIRPEHFLVAANDPLRLSLGPGQVTEVSFSGTHHRCFVAPDADPGSLLVAHLPAAAAPVPGDRIDLGIKSGDAIVLTTDRRDRGAAP